MSEALSVRPATNNGGLNQPFVSVIMNCYNSSEYLREAIDSVLAQTYTNWEIIFWDNQSTDESAKIFKSYRDPRLNYILAPEHTTLGQARNLAMKEAHGELIAFLDCDDLWMPRKLEKQICLFDNPAVGLIICDTIFFNEVGAIKQLYKRMKPPKGLVFRELLGSYFVSLETAVIRRSALDGMDHWFDSRFEVIEEYDFFVRLGRTWEVDFVDEVLAKWRVHSKSWTWTRPELFPRETQLFLEKLRQFHPNIEIDCSQEVHLVERKIATAEAILLWRSGQGWKARQRVYPYRNDGIRLRILTIWMWLPYFTFDYANKMRNGL